MPACARIRFRVSWWLSLFVRFQSVPRQNSQTVENQNFAKCPNLTKAAWRSQSCGVGEYHHHPPPPRKLKRDTQVRLQASWNVTLKSVSKLKAWHASQEATWSVAVHCVSNHPRTLCACAKPKARHLGNRPRRGRSCPRLALEHKYKMIQNVVQWCWDFYKSLEPDWTTTRHTSPDARSFTIQLTPVLAMTQKCWKNRHRVASELHWIRIGVALELHCFCQQFGNLSQMFGSSEGHWPSAFPVALRLPSELPLPDLTGPTPCLPRVQDKEKPTSLGSVLATPRHPCLAGRSKHLKQDHVEPFSQFATWTSSRAG